MAAKRTNLQGRSLARLSGCMLLQSAYCAERLAMSAPSTAIEATPSSGIVIGGSDLLPRHPVFRTHDLEQGRAHLCRALGEHKVVCLPHERRIDLRHRQAKVGPIALSLLQYGAGVMINVPVLPDFYLLQFTLAGECQMWQEGHYSVLSARSVAIANSGRAYRKAWMPGTSQLLLRIDKRLVEREFSAWTGIDEAGGIEFDIPPIDDMAKVGTFARYVRMLCDDLRSEASDLSHPLVADRVASGLVSLMLASMPHNKKRAIEVAGTASAPFFVRRVEQFIDEHARDDIVLADLTGVAGVSTRALQMGFRRFRDTTPMAYLRAIRLELARVELAKAGRHGASVATVANAVGFGHLGRFAHDYEARFGERPSETRRRSSLGRIELQG
jgi:AraC-like DNA-binding protein